MNKMTKLTEGPLGFPLLDQQAFALDAILKDLPREPAFAYRRVAVAKATTELMPGGRVDVSWISTEDPDRENEVVVAGGMNDEQFALNPIVTLQHAYALPPVGRSLWRKRVRDGERHGIKAKTHYPARPTDWTDEVWPPDAAFALVQSGMLNGKSIGFLPLKVHEPTEQEKARTGWAKVARVIDSWLLLEYACCYLPCQQNAVVETVGKTTPRALPPLYQKAIGWNAPRTVPFTSMAEVEKAIAREVLRFDGDEIARRAVGRAMGRV